ncbi:carboxymuconolactone decarboxylase family protein [Knoellia subterranea]|uniref:Carboxymuconolactone decarboxylase n=1 Tax=Knoellia subterranea KCTC 19937 TaxID=1385521 RepID=A0A0A0JMX6_9MICO|nr:carboxymuconolactone decarboxylase family protein [Knoellia subterranea]KGN38079.1 carboxymuconolactone decarboxylase [Knoellia subterranea KCTC 19937]
MTLTFPDHTTETAPAEAAPTLKRVAAAFGGTLPTAVARMAEAPQLLDAFLTTSRLFQGSTLTTLEQEVLILTVAVRNGCDVCIEMHAATLRRLGHADLEPALRADLPLDDARLAALQRFTHDVMDHTGAVPDALQNAFAAAGFTPRQALEVVLGVGAYTLSTYANRLTGA